MSAEPPPSPGTPAEPPPAPPSGAELWLEQLGSWARALQAWLRRPRVRLCVIGAALLITGALIVTSSVWTLPLVIGGAVMVMVAWVGPRLDGQFAVAWGAAGTRLSFRAEIRPIETAVRPAIPAADEVADADVVEGEAHTVEIDVLELKALIAAAERADATVPDGDGAAGIRIFDTRS